MRPNAMDGSAPISWAAKHREETAEKNEDGEMELI